MDDGLMLNIVSNRKNNHNLNESNSNGKIVSKTDVKKAKYAMKMKMRNKSAKSQRKQNNQQPLFTTSTSSKTLFNIQSQGSRQKIYKANNTKNTKIEQNEIKMQNGENSQIIKQKIALRRQRNKFRKDESVQSFKDRKKIISKTKVSQDINFRPDLRKDIKVSQLMPQAQEQKNYINTNNLQVLNLQPKLQDSLIKSGVNRLTEIQNKSFESLLNGCDSVIKASTGSGKTLAYLIPLINRIIKKKLITKREDGTAIIVICPTRQLCVQGQKQANRCLKRCPYIIPGCLFGGQQTNHEKSRLRKGTNILFCTPGRVLYHLQQTKSFKLNNLNAIVFEQADRTLDMGFHDSVKKIVEILNQKTSLSHIHKVLVSAHFNSKVSDLLQQLQMNDSNFIGFQNMDAKMQISKLKESKDVQINTSSQLKQQYVLMSQQQKIPLMLAYLGILKQSKVLIFVSTIDQVQFLDYLLNNLKFKDSNGNETQIKFESRPIFKIHGDLDQKLRSKTYLQFRQSKQAILISTEVASRGLDFPDLSHIILFDIPPTITDYGNRVGRSARFNQTGVSLLMLHYIQSDYAQKIRYFAPSLQVIQKDIIYQSFEKILKSMNIGDSSLHYIEGLVRSSVKTDQQKYTVARKAYGSMLRAYARLPEKQIFAVKKLNLKLLARSFGLNSSQNQIRFNPKAKSSHLQASRKKRKVQNIKKLQVSQYL